MATIYGTPVIFIKKPDTSEQWLLNSTVNPNYFGADKDFNVEFTSNNTSYSIFRLGKAANIILYGSTVVCSGGVMQDAYRQITLEKSATGELKTWLEANAIRLPLIGTYVFKNTPTAPSLDVDSKGMSSSTNISILFPDYTGTEPLLLTRIEASSDGTISFETYVDGEPNLVGAYSNGTWEDSSLRTITFTQPVQYQGNEEFVKWFTANAKEVKAENLYGYKITASTIPITVPDCTLSTRGSEEFEGTNPLFSALFWNSTSGTTFSDDNLRVKINSSVSYMVYRNGTGQYVRVSNAYIKETKADGYSIIMAQYASGHTTTSSFVKPSTPMYCTPLSSIDNLYFADEPTGDLLTWLNKYATKI